MVVSRVLFSSKNNTFGTPPELYKSLNEEFGPFQLDAATRESNPLGTPHFYTENDNALNKDWMKRTFCNPPYGKGIYNWVKKALEESVKGNLVVMFIPSRTGPKWFQHFIWDQKQNTFQDGVEVRFLPGRYRMYDYDLNAESKNVAPFDSMVVIFRPN